MENAVAHVKLDYCSSANTKLVETILNNCTKIRVLILHRLSLSVITPQLRNMNEIETLKLSFDRSSFDAEKFITLMEKLENLENLIIDNFFFSHATRSLEFVPTVNNRVAHLELPKDGGITHFQKFIFTNLTSVTVPFSCFSQMQMLKNFCNLNPTLRHLSVIVGRHEVQSHSLLSLYTDLRNTSVETCKVSLGGLADVQGTQEVKEVKIFGRSLTGNERRFFVVEI